MSTLRQKIVSTISALSLVAGAALMGVGAAGADAWGDGSGTGDGVGVSDYGGVRVTVFDDPKPSEPHWGQGTGSASTEWFIRQGQVAPSATQGNVRQSCQIALNNANAEGRALGYGNNARVVAILHTRPSDRGWQTFRSTHAFIEAWEQWRNAGFQGLGGDARAGGYIAELDRRVRAQANTFNGPEGVSICVAVHEGQPKPPVPPTGNITLKKKDANTGTTANIHKGTEFTATGPETVKLVVGADGTATAKGVKTGTYTVKETKAAPGYTVNPKAYSVTVEGNKTASVNAGNPIGNDKIGPGGKFGLVKKVVDTNGVPFPDEMNGIKLRIVADSLMVADPGEPIWTKVGASADFTVTNGMAQPPTLIGGTYTVTEVDTAGTNTLLNGGHIKVRVDADGATVTENTTKGGAEALVNDQWNALNMLNYPAPNISVDPADNVFANPPKYGLLKIVKQDDITGQGLDGTIFNVSNASGYSKDLAGTDAEGVIWSEPLPVGTYTVTEKTSPTPYLFAEPKSQEVQVTEAKTPAQAVVTTFENQEQLFDLNINKLDVTTGATAGGEATLEGAKFEVTVVSLVREGIDGQKQPGELVGTFTTDANGEFTVENLPLGEYEVREVQAPTGYVLNSTPIRVKAEYNLADGAKTTKVTQTVGNKSEALGDLNTVLTSDGRTPEATATDVDNATEGDFFNRLIHGRILVSKEDAKTNQTLEGAVYDITRKDSGDVVQTITTSADGFAISDMLPYGTYIVSEKTPPIPYMSDAQTNTWEVKIEQDGQIYGWTTSVPPTKVDSTLTEGTSPKSDNSIGQADIAATAKHADAVKNTEQLFTFTVAKQSLTKAGMGEATLEGAEFEVYVETLVREGINGQKQPGELVGKFTTDAEGKFTVENLPLGEYRVVETKAPNGFALNSEPIFVKATYDDPAKTHSDKITWRYGTNKSALDEEMATKHGELRNVLVGIYENGDSTVANPGDFDTKSVYTVPNTDVQPTTGAEGHYYDKVKLGRIQLNKHLEDSQDIKSGEKPIESDIDFALINNKGEVEQVITTNEDGNAASGWLPYGTYTLRQLTVPMSDGSRMAIGDTPAEGVTAVSTPIKDQTIDLKQPLAQVETDWVKISADYENAPNYMRLRMVKTDVDTGKNILQAGVEFQLFEKGSNTPISMISYGSPTKVVDRFTIDAEGYTDTFQKLQPGTYEIVEVAGPKGYTYDPEKRFEVVIPDGVTNNDQAVIITIDLAPLGSEDMVEHSVANQPQYGQLKITKTGEQFSKWETTQVEVNQQAEATVEKKETSTPQANVSLKLNSVVPNPDYEEGVDPANFATKHVSENVTTDENGAFTREVGEGTWTLMNGDEELTTITVEAGKTGLIEAQLPNLTSTEDIYTPGAIEKKSYDVATPVYETKALAGAKFTVTATEDVQSYDGQTVIYKKGETILFATMDIKADKDIYNESGRHLLWKKGDVVYKKGDALSYPKVAYTDEQVTDTLVSVDTEDGLNISRLPLGIYTVTETEAPLGWKVAADEATRDLTFSAQAFNIAYDSKAVEVDNPRQILNITLDKKELEAHPYFELRSVQNTVFGLFNKGEILGMKADTLMGVANPTADGLIAFKDVPQGDYYIKELSTLNGYVLNEGEFTASATHVISNDDQVEVIKTPVENNVDYNTIRIAKVDAVTGKTLNGATFELFAVEDGKEVPVINPATGDNTWDSNTDYQLPKGHYKAIEKHAPMGYVGEGTVVQIANAGDTVTEVRVSNHATEIALYKIDKDTGLPVEGAALALFSMDGKIVMLDENGQYDPEGTVEARWVSTDKPFIIKGLPVNTQFSLVETGTPDGYVHDDTPTVFSVAALVGVQSISRANEMTELHIKKVDGLTQKMLEGATLGVFEVGSDEPVKNPVTGEELVWTTGDKAKAVYGLRVGGVYEIRELNTPAGYVPPVTPYKVFIANTTEDQGAVIANLPTEVKALKTDAKSGDPLAGATLQIFDVDAGKVAVDPATGEELQWESDGTEKVVNRLPIGTKYELREIAAPDARYQIAKPIPFTIGEDGVASVTMENVFQPVSFGDKIWFDGNGDGIQNDNDTPLDCNCLGKTKIYLLVDDGKGNAVKVTKDTVGNYAATSDGVKGLNGAELQFDEDGFAYTTADCDGNYAFTNLISGKYGKEVHLSPECDMTFTTPNVGEADCEDSDTVPTDNPLIGRTGLFDVTPNGGKCVPSSGDTPKAPEFCSADPYLKNEDGSYKLDDNGEKILNPDCVQNAKPNSEVCKDNPFGLDNPCIDTGLVKITKDVPPEPTPPVAEKDAPLATTPLPKTGDAGIMFAIGALLSLAGIYGLLYVRRESRA